MLNKKKLNLTSSAVLLASAPALALQAQGGVDGVAGLDSKELVGDSLSNNSVITVLKVVGCVVVVVAFGYLLYYVANRMSSNGDKLVEEAERKESSTDEVKISADAKGTSHSKTVSVSNSEISTGNQKKGGFGLEPSIMNEEILPEEGNIEKNGQKSNKKEIENKDQIIKDLISLKEHLIGNKENVFDRKKFSALEKDYKEYLDKMEELEKEAKKCKYNLDYYEEIERGKFKDLNKVMYGLRKIIVSIKILMCQLNLEKLESQKGIGESVHSDEKTKLQNELNELFNESNKKYNGKYISKKKLEVNIESCLTDFSKLEKTGKYEDFPGVSYLVEGIFDYDLSKPESADWEAVCDDLNSIVEKIEEFKEEKIEINIENSADIKRNRQNLSEFREKFNKARNAIVEDLEDDKNLPFLDVGDIGEDLFSNKIEG